MGEKSEKATPKKMRDARKKGQVAKSVDFPASFTFIVSISTVLGMSGYIFNLIFGFLKEMLSNVANAEAISKTPFVFCTKAIYTIFHASIPIMALVSGVGVLVQFLIVGPVFSMEAMKPDIKRLNPITNIKNMFKVKTVIELLKSIFKISGAIIIIYFTIKNALPEIIATINMPIVGAALVFAGFLKKVVLRVGIFFIMIGVFDLAFQRKNFNKEMMMEKFEIKQEHKDTEGDPHMKGKRKQMSQEIAYQDGPSAAKNANAVISNPTHIAVAIGYEADNDPAPKIMTMGLNNVAQEIINIAVTSDIPVMRNVDLAQELYYKSKIGDYVPEETYQAISEILKWVEELEKEQIETEALAKPLEILKDETDIE
jgi:type III secretion protein U